MTLLSSLLLIIDIGTNTESDLIIDEFGKYIPTAFKLSYPIRRSKKNVIPVNRDLAEVGK